jgi:hypothetical protein
VSNLARPDLHLALRLCFSEKARAFPGCRNASPGTSRQGPGTFGHARGHVKHSQLQPVKVGSGARLFASSFAGAARQATEYVMAQPESSDDDTMPAGKKYKPGVLSRYDMVPAAWPFARETPVHKQCAACGLRTQDCSWAN